MKEVFGGLMVGIIALLLILFGALIGYQNGLEDGEELISPAPMDAVDWKKIAPITMNGFYQVASYDDVCYIHIDVGGSDVQ